MDRRFISLRNAPVQVRKKAEDDKESSTIEGYAAVFYREDDPGSEYWLYDDFVERILPGAFDEAIKGDDVRALFNHNPNFLLGRSSAKTLRLKLDKTGLRYEIDPPDTQTARDVLASIERGDLTGSSFSFMPKTTRWREEDREGKEIWIREIESVQLYDVGPVTYPAYESTSTGVRSIDDAKEATEALARERSVRADLARKLRSYDCQAKLAEIELTN